MGPEGSGSKLLSEAILDHHDVEAFRLPLPVDTMANQLNGGMIDAGLFTTAVPSEALRRILADPAMRLLSVESQQVARLGGGLSVTTFEDGTYGSQLEGEPTVRTVATRSVLVTTVDDPRIDVDQITRAIFEGADFLGIDGGPEALAESLSSIPLHPEAVGYYEEVGFLPSPPQEYFGIEFALWMDWFRVTWQGLVILTILVGAYQGLLKLRRDWTTNEVGRRLFGISVEPTETRSVSKLVQIRREIRERVRRRWWQGGEINKDRWRILDGLVNTGIQEAKEHLERTLITDIRKPSASAASESEDGSKRFAELRERIWTHLENGELDAEQQYRLCDILAESDTEKSGQPSRSSANSKRHRSLSSA